MKAEYLTYGENDNIINLDNQSELIVEINNQKYLIMRDTLVELGCDKAKN